MGDCADRAWTSSPASFVGVVAVAVVIGPVGVAAPAGLAALLAAAAVAAAWGRDVRETLRRTVSPAAFGVLAVFLLWSVASALWAPIPSRAGEGAFKVLGLCLLGLVAAEGFARAVRGRRRALENALLASLGLGCALAVAAFAYAELTGAALFGDYASIPLTTLSRGQSALVLLSLAVVAVLWRRGLRARAGAVAVGVAALLSQLHSLAPILALAAGLGTMAAAALFGRRVLAAMAAAAAVAVLLAPLAVRALPDGDVLYQKIGLVQPSAAHRVYTWHFVADRIGERPWRGWGFDSSRRISGGEAPVTPRVPAADPAEAVPVIGTAEFMARVQTLPLHPHNAALQVWLELGLPGALMMAWVVARLYWSSRAREDVGDAALGAGLATGYLVLGALSYGVWQSWWIALGWLMAAFAAGLAANEGESPGGARAPTLHPTMR
jgi:O-antigen ligase